MLNTFHSIGGITVGLNSSFIALIPKKNSPTVPTDYRPISLINSTMKILLKILANRLKAALPIIISEEQYGFMIGRRISDAMKTKKCKGVILKLDFEKAFDTINWDFLYETLKHMNFGPRWINWIKSIFNTIRISILVNGSPTNEFSPSRGLRQGDPLSPLFFNIVRQVLHHLLDIAKQQGKLTGIDIGQDNITLTHLQFADDTLLLINGDDESISGVKRILIIFQLLSGLKVNFHKSELIAMNYS